MTTPDEHSFDEAAFHEAQRKRYESRRATGARFEGPFARTLKARLREHFPDLLDQEEEFQKNELATCFAKAPIEQVELLFFALTKAVEFVRISKEVKEFSASDKSWIAELLCYATLRAINRSTWGLTQGRDKVHFVASTSRWVVSIGVLGFDGYVITFDESGHAQGALDLSEIRIEGDPAASILGAIYDQVFGSTHQRRTNSAVPLNEAQKGALREHFASARLEKTILIPFMPAPGTMSHDQLDAVLAQVVEVIGNAFVVGTGEDDKALMHQQTGISTAQLQAKIEKIFAQVRSTVDEPAPSQPPRTRPSSRASGPDYEWDVFVSHSSNDKLDYVDELVRALEARKLQVWYDKKEIRLGQSIPARINDGLARSRAVVVVFSKSFLTKGWTMAELEAAFSADLSNRSGRVLPVLKDVTTEELAKKHPLFASLLCANAAEGTERVVDQIIDSLDSMPD